MSNSKQGINLTAAVPFTLLLITLLFTGSSEAQAASFSLTATTKQLDVGAAAELFVDEQATLQIEQVASESFHWPRTLSHTVNDGYTAAAYWLRFDLENPLDTPQQVYLELANPLHDQVDLYAINRQSPQPPQHQGSGDTRPPSTRLIDHHYFVFPLRIKAGQKLTLILRVQSSSAMQLPLSLYSADGFIEHDQFRQLAQGIFFGIILLMILYNAFFYARTRERAYLYYVLYASSFLLFQSALQGFIQQYLPYSPWLQENILLLGALLTIIFAAHFARAFLHLPEHSPRLAKLLRSYALLSATAIVATGSIGYTTIAQFMLALAMLTSATILIAGARQWRHGRREARLFTIAWITLLTAFFISALGKFGLLPGANLLDYLIQVGSVVEITLLSLALSERINREKAMRCEAQQQLLQAEQGMKKRLEEEVALRTDELKQAFDQLRAANTELSVISRTDPLTRVPNRYSFDERFSIEYADAERRHNALSIALLDIDHFKQVNDTHGHQLGDRVLREVAATIDNYLQRPRDELFRYGGEEFIILFPDTPEAEARRLADEIRCRVAAIKLDGTEISLPITVSAGISSTGAAGYHCSPDALLRQADSALYQAKEMGRNRVI